MKHIKRFIALFLIVTIVGCSTTTERASIAFDTLKSNGKGVVIKNFKANKSRESLFVGGTLVNLSGADISNIEIESRGYNEDNKLISVDRIKIAQKQLGKNEKISFSMVLVKNVNQINAYHFFGKYDLVKTRHSIDWAAIGSVLLTAGVVVAVVAAAYSQSYQFQPAYYPTLYQPAQVSQPTPVYYSPQVLKHPQVDIPSSGGVFGEYNPSNPFSVYSSPFGKYNPNNPFSEYTSPFGSMNPKNPFSEVSSPFGSMNPKNPFSEVSSPFGSMNPKNPFSEVSSPFGEFNPKNPFGEGIDPYHYQKYYLEEDE